MTEKKSPVISFKDFSFQYRAQKKPTLTGINLDIYPGEKVLIAGPSGSGKSTLAGCINGLNPFSNPGECKGTLTVDGVNAPHSSIFELSAHVGTVLQDPDGQFIGLTVGEDIAFALENSCTPQDEMHAITRHAAELVGIENHLDYAPHELSGGQKQRVSLAESIPVVKNDFIFSAICEELGGIFAICLILVCMSFFLMIVNIALRIINPFYKLIALGLGTEYAFQVFLTIGGATKFIPMTGVTLPLVSYGGSSLLCTILMLAIIQGLYILREDEDEEFEKRRQEAIQRIREREEIGRTRQI